MAAPHVVFRALGDPIRLEIVERLARGGPSATGELLTDLGVSRQAAAKHLQVLEEAGLVVGKKNGRIVRRQFNGPMLYEVAEWLSERAGMWESKIARLTEHLERPSPNE